MFDEEAACPWPSRGEDPEQPERPRWSRRRRFRQAEDNPKPADHAEKRRAAQKAQRVARRRNRP